MEQDKTQERLILLNPGPVNLTSRVRNALMNPDMCHREPEFSELQEKIRRALVDVYGLSQKDYTCVLLTGSGTAAVEAMVTSLIPHDGKLLILINGVYGERIQRIAECHNIAYTVIVQQWGEELDSARIEDALREDKEITHVAVIHHETTTGRLNDLSMVGTLCRRYEKKLLVDAVSSFGAEELQFDEWGITACSASANKCLHGVPGASFVVAQRKCLEESQVAFSPNHLLHNELSAPSARTCSGRACSTKAKQALPLQPTCGEREFLYNQVTARSVYMDLFSYYQKQESGSSPFTHAVHVFYAFAEALAEHEGMGGWGKRKERYDKLSFLIRRLAHNIEIRQYLTRGLLASSLTAFYLPDNVSYQELHDRLRQAGFVIYAGQGKLSSTIFRIANMGTLTEEEIKRLFETLEEVNTQ